MDNFTVRVKLSGARGYNSIETGGPILTATGNDGKDSRPFETRMHTQGPIVYTAPT